MNDQLCSDGNLCALGGIIAVVEHVKESPLSDIAKWITSPIELGRHLGRVMKKAKCQYQDFLIDCFGKLSDEFDFPSQLTPEKQGIVWIAYYKATIELAKYQPSAIAEQSTTEAALKVASE